MARGSGSFGGGGHSGGSFGGGHSGGGRSFGGRPSSSNSSPRAHTPTPPSHSPNRPIHHTPPISGGYVAPGRTILIPAEAAITTIIPVITDPFSRSLRKKAMVF